MSAYLFRPVDTWFFKEARPMDGFGGTELASVFPPPVRTLLGALRTAAGDQMGVDWKRFPEDYPDLAMKIGDANSYGKLECHGVFPSLEGKTLYPVPKHIVSLKSGKETTFEKMRIGGPIVCDLGKVRLPELPVGESGERFKVFEEDAWVDREDLWRILQGDLPQSVYTKKGLLSEEPRVGIERNNSTRIVKKGMLYMTRHLRLRSDVAVSIEVDGFDEGLENRIVRLGGEGRGAYFIKKDRTPLPFPEEPKGQMEGWFFALLTPALVDPIRPLEGVEVASACVGKSFREGGFDMKGRRSRSARAYLPAGSVWFVEASDPKEAKRMIETYHETKIGDETQLGRGRIVCGYWTK